MKQNIAVAVASGLFLGVATFDLIPSAARALTVPPAALWVAAGLVGWVILKRLTNRVTQAGLAVVSSLGFWLHSFLEGAAVAVSFAISPRLGLLVGLGMLLHLVPEFAAITTLLRAEGLSHVRSVAVDLVGIVVLWATAGVLALVPLGDRVLNVLEALTAGAFIAISLMSYLSRRRTVGTALGLLAGVISAVLWRRLVS